MDMLFRVINFLILAAALVFVAKKMNLIDKMFVSRRRQVSKELDEADKAVSRQNPWMPTLSVKNSSMSSARRR